MNNINTLTQTQLNRIQSQMGLSDTFNVLSIEKEITSFNGQAGYQARCQIPEDWYLITVQDQQKGFKINFVRLNNLGWLT